MENERCQELANIEYQNMLLNGVKKTDHKNKEHIGTIENMEDFLEKEKMYESQLPWGKLNKTKRYEKIWVKADNIEEEMYFGPQKEKKYDFKTNSYTANDLLILEAVCVQHEIDHLNGVTIYDR